jgi:hypothetical protein
MTPGPELEVVHGIVGDLEDPVGEGPLHQATPTRALLDIPSIARARVEGGKRVVVQRAPGASDEDLAWMLSGPVRQLGWLQQGSMALRASGVAIGGRAVAIAGPASSGKSVVAAALARRGHAVLADAALPIDVEPPVTAHGVGGTVGLWPHAVELLGLDPAAGEIVRPALAKRAHRFQSAASAPLAAVAILDRNRHRREPATERLRGTAALGAVTAWTAMGPLVAPLGLTTAHFRWASGLVSQVPIVRIDLDRHRPDLPAVADAVEALAS